MRDHRAAAIGDRDLAKSGRAHGVVERGVRADLDQPAGVDPPFVRLEAGGPLE
ncbi:MAG: hypothetical protein IPK75_18080 [Acidobacteria bacterium]|nr:hypothetical protein [Acidobacteriota bacterium]